MKKVLLLPDSFKGTMSSLEICKIMERAIKGQFPACEVVSIPAADGGEGTVASFLEAVGGQRIVLRVKGPYMEDMESFYGILPDGTAVIEMAAAAGLPLVGDNRHAELTTTYGVGQLMLDALSRGCKKLVLGLGGSATNDLGCGAAAAVGVRFLDEGGNSFVPVGASLDRICSIDLSEAEAKLAGVSVVAMCDIDNPPCGPNGTAYAFGPQKGADPAMVEQLDQKLRAAAGVIKNGLGIDIAALPGGGSAGGMGAGAVAFFSASLQMGIEALLDTVDFDRLAEGADYVFTGEGRIDSQSLRGKVVIGVAHRAKRLGLPVIAVVGDIADGAEESYSQGVDGIFSINRLAIPFAEARPRAARDMFLTVDNLVRFIKCCEDNKR